MKEPGCGHEGMARASMLGRERAGGELVLKASGKEGGGHGTHQLEDERPVAVELE